MGKKNMDYHRKLLDNLPSTYKKWFNEEDKYLNKFIKKNSTVLSIACGDGREISYIKNKASKIVGVDHDKEAVKHANSSFKDQENINIVQGDATNLQFKDNSFDYVICMASFTNFGDIKLKALLEMERIVKPEGNIILSVYSEDAMPERMKVYKKIDRAYEKIKEIRKDGTVIFDKSLGDNISEQFSKEKLKSLFGESKLNVEEIKKVGIGYICRLSK